jgi:hypothetical protein
MNNDEFFRDACWKLYQEHCTHMRHHETQRSTVAASILTIAAVVVGVITFDKQIVPTDLPLSVLLIVLGAFGALFSAKQYERASMHTERARRYRDAIDSMLDGAPLKKLKRAADEDHAKAFPRLESLRLNRFWGALYLLLSLLGVALSLISILIPYRAA